MTPRFGCIGIRRAAPPSVGSAAGFIVCLVLACLAGTGARAADEPFFAVYKLSVPDYLQHHWVEDLDNDGRKDILVVHSKGLPPDETRWVSLFWQGADGSFSTAANQSWELDREAAVLDIGDVAGDANKEICYLTPRDFRFHVLEEGGYRTEADVLFETEGMAVYASRRRLPLINVVRDWTGGGADDVAVFTFGGLVLHTPDGGGGYAPSQRVEVDLETRMYQSDAAANDDKTLGLRAHYLFPDITLVDYDGDGRRDLLTTTDDRVGVHLRGEDGFFSATTDREYLFDVLTQQEKLEDIAEVDTDVVDLDGDGFVDAVVSKQTAKGLTNFRGVIHVYWGKPGGYPDVPDQVIISEGTASARTMFWDVNGDGRKDLVLPSIKFSVAALIRILITRNIKVYFNIYLLGPDGRYSDRPDFTKEVKYKIDFSGESDDQATDLEGDYNGDRRTDFVFATGEEELSIYLGVTDDDRLFSKKPVAKIRVDAYGELMNHDLNNDGYSDMVLHYPQSKERKGTLEVLVNLKRIQ